jgi:hypothetical protein
LVPEALSPIVRLQELEAGCVFMLRYLIKPRDYFICIQYFPEASEESDG